MTSAAGESPRQPAGAPVGAPLGAPRAAADAATRTPSPVPAVVPSASDRRARSDRRGGPDRRKQDVPVTIDRRTGQDRRTLPERRTTDPGKTAGGYDLDAETLEFIHAINRFKAENGRPFPTWSEVLSILRTLGYEKRSS
jgi:hypothetical protein